MSASTACETQPLANGFAKGPHVSDIRQPERPSFEEVKKELAGQTLTIPDLRLLFKHWPQGANPALGSLEHAILDGVEKFGMKPEHRESLVEANVANFAAQCWPEADLDILKFSAHLVMWTWGIEGYTDTLVADEETAKNFRSEAKSVWCSMLGLSDLDVTWSNHQEPAQHYRTVIASFKPLAARCCQMFDPESRQLLLDELFIYLKGTELEANMRGSRQMPSYDGYMHMRTMANGSGFFLVLSGLYKLAGNQAVVGKSPPWVGLKETAATINFLVNDLLSAKREFKTGEYLNSILLRAHDLHSVDASATECIARIKSLVQDFDHQAQAILADTPQTNDARTAAAGAIRAMHSFNVGSLEWRQVVPHHWHCFRLFRKDMLKIADRDRAASLNVKRYGLRDHTMPDGTIRLKLEQ